MVNLYSTEDDEPCVAPVTTARPGSENARASRPEEVPNRDPGSDTLDDGDGNGDDTHRRRRRAAASPRVSDSAFAPVVVSPRNARARPKRTSPGSTAARRSLFPASANASEDASGDDDENDNRDARGARPSAGHSALEAIETHPTDYDDSDDDDGGDDGDGSDDGDDGGDDRRHHLNETPSSPLAREEFAPGDASRRESPQEPPRSEDGDGSGGFAILRRVGGAVVSAAGGAVATVAGAAAEGAYDAALRVARRSADLDASSPATASRRESSPSLETNRRARGRWLDARRLVSADLAREYPSGPNGDGSLPSSTFGWLVAKSRDAVRAAADGTKSLVRASSSRLRPRARKVGRSRSFARLSPDEMIPEKDRLPPVRPRAPLGGPRGRQLWKKVRDNRMLLIGEGLGTGSSSYWRRRAGVTAFLFSVDMDINGKRKSKAEMLNRAAAKLKKSTKFPRSEAFDRELAELELTPHQIHRLCKEQRMKIRDGPNPIKPSLLKVRLLHLMHGKYGNDWFEPTPFGRNWLGYWMPLVLALVQCFMISFVTVGVTYAAYTLGEHWHHAYRCDKIWNWMNPQCQVADFVRTNAKQWVYKWYYQVGSVIAMRAGAWADALSKEAGKMAVEATEKMSEKLRVDGVGGEGGYIGNGDEEDE